MPTVSRIQVENPDELLATDAYGAGALIRVESSATSGSGFSELGTVAIVTATYAYTYHHAAGTSGLYYRSRYSNAGATRLSDYSDEWQANAAPATLCTLYNVKQRLGIVATDVTDDETLLDFISGATQWIHGRTQRLLLPDPASGTTTYTFDGSDSLEDGRLLLIPRGIRSVSLLEVAPTTGGTFTTVAAGDYFIRPAAHERTSGWPGTELWMSDAPSSSTTYPYFPPGFSNVRITGAFGWAVTPADVSEIAETLTVAAWRQRSSSGAESFETGTDGVQTFTATLSSKDWRTLARYTYRPVMVV